jgi:hypothetical protein
MTAEVVRFPVGISREIARLREITAESANNQLLGEGPPHPEAALLDLCAEALHLLTHAERALAACQRMLFASVASGVQPQNAIGCMRSIAAVSQKRNHSCGGSPSCAPLPPPESMQRRW